jgi:hypothetical protein
MLNNHNWGGDFALYIHQAEALLNCTTYELAELNSFALQHSSYDTFSPELYPWGWPLLLVPIIAIFGLNYLWLKVYMSFFFLGMVGLSYKLIASKTDKIAALIISSCLIVNAPFVLYNSSVLSEFPFMFAVILSLILYYKQKLRHVCVDTIDTTELNDYRSLIKPFDLLMLFTTAFVLFLATLIRTEGYLLVLAILISEGLSCLNFNNKLLFLIKNKWQFIILFCFVLLHVFHHYLLPHGSSAHLDHFKLLTIDSLLDNVYFYVGKLPIFFSSFLTKSLFLVLLGFAYIGMIIRWNKDRVMVLFVVLLQLLLIVWPHQNFRHLFVQVPFLFYFIYQGLVTIGFSIKGINVSTAKLFFLLVFIGLCYNSILILPRQITAEANIEGPESIQAKEMFEFINRKTEKDAVIVFFKPRVMSLYTKRKSYLVNDTTDKIRRDGDYLVIHKYKDSSNQLSEIVFNPPDWLVNKFENNFFVIYKILEL